MALSANALVLFKTNPAKVLELGEKIKIELISGTTKSVRPKDVVMIHPGPVATLAGLTLENGNIDDAREMIEDEVVSLEELAEYVYDEFTPQSAWTTWRMVEAGLYFKGTLEEITATPQEHVDNYLAEQAAKEAAKAEWADSISRIKSGAVTEADDKNLNEIERLGFGLSKASRVMKELGLEQSPEKAHQLLMKLGRWTEQTNPYPRRFGCAVEDPTFDVPPLPEEERKDLTHLAAYAIDDDGNKDPDDAISIDGDRLWIHVADVAALIQPESEIDVEAQSRGANLYIPEGCIHMLPHAITEQLGLGLSEISPALSFGLTFDDEMNISDMEITPSLVKVTRTTYREVHDIIDYEEPYKSMYDICKKFKERRRQNGATSVSMPEVRILVEDGTVSIRPLPPYDSCDLVSNAMMMAGEAAAIFCNQNDIPIPYVTQPSPDPFDEGDDYATSFSNIKKYQKSEVKMHADHHAGLGLDAYTRATSPLRRYSDLLVHQQIRAFLKGEEVMSEETVLEKLAEFQDSSLNIRFAERESNKHWTTVYLKQNPEWTGKAVLIDKRDNRGLWLIPALAMQTRLQLKSDLPLNSETDLTINSADVPEQLSRFRMV